MPKRRAATGTRTRYQGRAAIAAMLGISPDLLAHWTRRHPEGMPEPDAEVEGAGSRIVPVWLPGRDAEWRAWRATFPGRTGRPRKGAPPLPARLTSRPESAPNLTG
jgi:hypothetical protein